MPTYSNLQIQTADNTNIVDYALSKGADLRNVGGKFLWQSENVWLCGNSWYSFYDQEGGHAISFLEKYFNMTFPEAVSELLGGSINKSDNYILSKTVLSPVKTGGNNDKFTVPEKNADCRRVFAYLIKERGILPEIVTHFVKAGTVYEDVSHNCVFVGKDEAGAVKHCHRRGTVGSFKNNISGSDARYSFHHTGTDDKIFVFEAPIDMLAYISMNPLNWKGHSYVALCSVADKALFHQLEVHKDLRKIYLCLDNDTAGQEAEKRIKESLESEGYTDVTILTPINKDWDEDAKIINKIQMSVKGRIYGTQSIN